MKNPHLTKLSRLEKHTKLFPHVYSINYADHALRCLNEIKDLKQLKKVIASINRIREESNFLIQRAFEIFTTVNSFKLPPPDHIAKKMARAIKHYNAPNTTQEAAVMHAIKFLDYWNFWIYPQFIVKLSDDVEADRKFLATMLINVILQKFDLLYAHERYQRHNVTLPLYDISK